MRNDILDEGLFERERAFDRITQQRIERIKGRVNESIRNVKNGRNAMLVLAFFTLLTYFIFSMTTTSFSGTTDYSAIMSTIFVVSIYLVAGIFTAKNPSVFLTLGLSIWALLFLLNMLFLPENILSGIIWKVVICYYLTVGVSHAFKLKKLEEELLDLGVPKHELANIKRLKAII